MKDKNPVRQAAEILDSPTVDIDIKYILANFVERNTNLKDVSLYNAILELTKSVNNLLDAMNKEKLHEELPTRRAHKLLPRIELREGQHVIFFTSSLEDARALAKKIAMEHQRGHLVYDVDSGNEMWLNANIRHEVNSKSISIMPRQGMTSDESFEFNPEQGVEYIEQYIRNKIEKEKYDYVLGVSLTTTETLVGMATEHWERFIWTSERGGTDRIHKLPSNWVCFYCLSELQKPEHIRKFLDLLAGSIIAHDIPAIQDETEGIIVGSDAILKCYEAILERKIDELLPI